MTMRMSADDQFRFLLSCVKWSNNGRVDFEEVAHECGVVSKGAAAKRYERMLKSHGIYPGGGSLEGSPSSRDRLYSPALKTGRKRKLDEFSPHFKHAEIDDEKPRIPKYPPRTPRPPNIKQEPPPLGYWPYMYHPMMLNQHPYMQRPVPPSMLQGRGPMPQPAGPMSYPMMHAVPPGGQAMLPPHTQMPPFQMHGRPPSSSQTHDTNIDGTDPLQDFYAPGFVDCGGFEALLNEDQGMTNDVSESATSRPTNASMPAPTVLAPQIESSTPTIKTEPLTPNTPAGFEHEPCEMPSMSSSNGMMAIFSSASTAPYDPASHLPREASEEASRVSVMVKEESEKSCICILD